MTSAEVYERLAALHAADLSDPRFSAEGLDAAMCGPQVQHMAQYAIAAAYHGLDAETWRASIMAEAGPDAARLVADAEECMRGSGIWPWHDRPGAGGQ
jgi:hypothetical protein